MNAPHTQCIKAITWLHARCSVHMIPEGINNFMLTDTEWDLLLNPHRTAPHIHYYANQVYNKSNPEPYTLHMLKCIVQLPKREQHQWYILEDVLYHLPTYKKTYHKYQAGDKKILSHDSMLSLNKIGRPIKRKKKQRTQ